MNVTPSAGRAAYDHIHADAGLHPVNVSGVGDAAFRVSNVGTTGIYALTGTDLVVVTVTVHGSGASPTRQTIELAKTAVSRV